MSVLNLTDLRTQKMNQVEIMLFHMGDRLHFHPINIMYYDSNKSSYVSRALFGNTFIVAPDRIKAFS